MESLEKSGLATELESQKSPERDHGLAELVEDIDRPDDILDLAKNIQEDQSLLEGVLDQGAEDSHAQHVGEFLQWIGEYLQKPVLDKRQEVEKLIGLLPEKTGLRNKVGQIFNNVLEAPNNEAVLESAPIEPEEGLEAAAIALAEEVRKTEEEQGRYDEQEEIALVEKMGAAEENIISPADRQLAEAAATEMVEKVFGETPPLAAPAAAEKVSGKAEKADESDIYRKFQDRLGLKTEELDSLEGFSGLSRGKKLLVLENMTQITLGRVREEAGGQFEDRTKNIKEGEKGVGRIASLAVNNLLKGFTLARLEKQKAADLQAGGLAEHGAVLALMIASAENSPEVLEIAGGKIEIQFVDVRKWSGEIGEARVARSYNQAANAFLNLPKEWSYAEASPAQKKEYEAAKQGYEKAKEEYLAMEAKWSGKMAACLDVNAVDAKVAINQFLNQNPEAEEELLAISSQSELKKGLFNILKNSRGRGLSMGAGFAARSLAVASAGAIGGLIAAPLIGGLIGAWRGRERAKQSLLEKDKKARRGAENQGEEAKNFVPAAHLVKRLGDLMVQYEEAADNNPAKAGQIMMSLKARIDYVQNKIDEGLVDFGLMKDVSVKTRREQNEGVYEEDKQKIVLGQQLKLVQGLCRARAFVAAENGRIGEDSELRNRLDRVLGARAENIAEARKDFVKNKALKGAAMGAGFAAAGWVIRDLAGEYFHWLPGKGKASNLASWGKQALGGTETGSPASSGFGALGGAIKEAAPDKGALAEEAMATGNSPLAFEAVDVKGETVGYQGGHSVWQEAERQLQARHSQDFAALGGGDASRAEALRNLNIGRISGAITADPEKYGLPAGTVFEKMTAEQIKNINWDKAFADVFQDKGGLVEEIKNLDNSLGGGQGRITPMTEPVFAGPTEKDFSAPGSVDRVADFISDPNSVRALENLSGHIKESVAAGSTIEEIMATSQGLRQAAGNVLGGELSFDSQGNIFLTADNSIREIFADGHPVEEEAVPIISFEASAAGPLNPEEALAEVNRSEAARALTAIERISPKNLKELARDFQNEDLPLRKLKEFTPDMAKAVRHHKGYLDLGGVEKIDVKALRILGRKEGMVNLFGLKDFSADAYDALKGKVLRHEIILNDEARKNFDILADKEQVEKGIFAAASPVEEVRPAAVPVAAGVEADFAEAFPEEAPQIDEDGFKALEENPFWNFPQDKLVFADDFSGPKEEMNSHFQSLLSEREAILKAYYEAEHNYGNNPRIGDFEKAVAIGLQDYNHSLEKMVRAAAGQGNFELPVASIRELSPAESGALFVDYLVKLNHLEEAPAAVAAEEVGIDQSAAETETILPKTIANEKIEVKGEGGNSEAVSSGVLRGFTGEENLNMKEIYKITNEDYEIEGFKMESRNLSLLADRLKKIDAASAEAEKIRQSIAETIELNKKIYGTDKIFSDQIKKLAGLS